MTEPAVGFAGGKLILTGEHAVVYGFPAIAVGLDLGTTVRLEPVDGETHVASEPADDRLLAAVRAALPAEGLCVRVSSDLPIGCGMGSSAALSVALVRAHAALEGRALTPDREFTRSLELEKVFHGTPSGLDNTVAAYGGAIRFERGDPPKIRHLTPPSCTLVVLESGEAGDTAALVAGVRSRHPGNQPTLDAIGALTAEIEAKLDDPASLGPLLTRNHRLLAELGVSNARLDELVELALAHGALGAKLSGAGGGGVVLALVEDPQPLLDAAAARRIPAHLVTLGGRA
ncbi:MAG: mevalonate kinase [Deltaproteobacteria bacterium]|nr:MAG: mevalonate kinase [Deltaproteobacteria bacterium]